MIGCDRVVWGDTDVGLSKGDRFRMQSCGFMFFVLEEAQGMGMRAERGLQGNWLFQRPPFFCGLSISSGSDCFCGWEGPFYLQGGRGPARQGIPKDVVLVIANVIYVRQGDEYGRG